MHIVIFGATASIAQATARIWAGQAANFTLVARDEIKLNIVVNDLKARGANNINALVCNFDQPLHVIDFLNQHNINEVVDVLYLAQGILPDQELCIKDFSAFQHQLQVNFSSVVAVLNKFVSVFNQQRHGSIVVIGSVAGDRGRKSNFVYGSSKAALDCYLSGLRNQLQSVGVQVLTVKPGFVDTPMTSAIKKNFLFAKPESVAADIVQAVANKKDIIYTPFFWRWIMFIICKIPEKIFKRLSL